jgi:phosphoenolpyruvate carboxykinase (ATP)
MLGERIATHDVRCWLVNTGWTGGPHGEGHRINLPYTRAMVNAVLGGSLLDVPTRTDPVFGLEVPMALRGVPARLLDPRSTWSDSQGYDEQAGRLAAMFRDNFATYADQVSAEVRAAGPRL